MNEKAERFELPKEDLNLIGVNEKVNDEKNIKREYSDEELEEFRQIILKKLDKAKKDYEVLKSSINHDESNDTMDTSPTFKVLEEGATTLSKEEAGKLAQRQLKFPARAGITPYLGQPAPRPRRERWIGPAHRGAEPALEAE